MKRLILAILMMLGGTATAQVRGTVLDARTGEPLPYVNIVWACDATAGTVTDFEGHFTLKRIQGCNVIMVKYVGYHPKTLELHNEKNCDSLVVELKPSVNNLAGVTITASRKREKYKRKGNPAVMLMDSVIAHKRDNRVEALPAYRTDCYEKMTLALDRFDFDLDSSRFLRDFAFVKPYLDTSGLTKVPVLGLSLREVLSSTYHRNGDEETVVHAKRMNGVDKVLDKEGLSANLEQMFQSTDITENTMELLLNRFVSPLSSSMGTTFYRFYIEDTVPTDDMGRCVKLSFVPVNRESYGFSGHIDVLIDRQYAVQRYSLTVPRQINLNFVSDITVEQQYGLLGDTLWAPTESHTYVNFYLFKWMRQIYAHQTRIYTEYDLTDATPIDSVGNTLSDEQWEELRPVPLRKQEVLLPNLMDELRGVPKFNRVIRTGEILISGYIPVTKGLVRDGSLFDIGPIFQMASYNPLEGLRLRLGGMTTANLSDHAFASGHLAYGFRDQRWKYNATAIYSLVPKEYHPYESFRHAFYLSSEYDVEVPGREYGTFARDNIFQSIVSAHPSMIYQYVQRNRLRYEREWPNRMSLQLWIQNEVNEAAGDLHYRQIGTDGHTLTTIPRYSTAGVGLQVRYAPGEAIYNNRLGSENLFNLAHDNPVVTLKHQANYLEGFGVVQRTDFSVTRRFWLGAFGHIDGLLSTGLVWNRAPFPMLFVANTNPSYIMNTNSFNLMQPLEFISDAYLSLFATYYLKGWIFNRIPLINRLKLREVVSFSGMIGTFTTKNNPKYSPVGLYALPEQTHVLGSTPYMEMAFGVENILHFLRIDYVRRLTYLNLPGAQRDGIRVSFKFEF